MSSPRLSLRIELPNGSRLGPGKIALLVSLRKHRSIAAAARDHEMSYRRAWLLVDDLNRAFAEPVVETFPGRSHGAGAVVTPFGERLIALYQATERRALRAAEGTLAELSNACNKRYASSAAIRTPRKSDVRGA